MGLFSSAPHSRMARPARLLLRCSPLPGSGTKALGAQRRRCPRSCQGGREGASELPARPDGARLPLQPGPAGGASGGIRPSTARSARLRWNAAATSCASASVSERPGRTGAQACRREGRPARGQRALGGQRGRAGDLSPYGVPESPRHSPFLPCDVRSAAGVDSVCRIDLLHLS